MDWIFQRKSSSSRHQTPPSKSTPTFDEEDPGRYAEKTEWSWVNFKGGTGLWPVVHAQARRGGSALAGCAGHSQSDPRPTECIYIDFSALWAILVDCLLWREDSQKTTCCRKIPDEELSFMIKTVEWLGDGVRLIDQLKLPAEEVYPVFRTYEAVAEAIRKMVVRGAPAIGVTAALGIVLGIKNNRTNNREEFVASFRTICEVMRTTRPTAVNLFWAINRMKKVFENVLLQSGRDFDANDIAQRLETEAVKIYEEDIACNKAMAQNGARLIPEGASILTHCNTGALATAGFYGTALGVIKAAHEQGKKISVWVDETRPYLQGARLTAWECQKEGIPHTLITDNMAGHFMKLGKVQCVIVGADRIASNGDTANKIGTYSLSVLAKEHHLPFYITAPTSTIDPGLKSGDEIPIEERSSNEVTHIQSIAIAPAGTRAAHPAFDVTPARHIHNIITERGILYKPFEEAIHGLFSN